MKPEFKISFNLEKYIQSFFDKIADTISDYRILREEDKKKRKLEEIERKERERLLQQKKKNRRGRASNKT